MEDRWCLERLTSHARTGWGAVRWGTGSSFSLRFLTSKMSFLAGVSPTAAWPGRLWGLREQVDSWFLGCVWQVGGGLLRKYTWCQGCLLLASPQQQESSSEGQRLVLGAPHLSLLGVCVLCGPLAAPVGCRIPPPRCHGGRHLWPHRPWNPFPGAGSTREQQPLS